MSPRITKGRAYAGPYRSPCPLPANAPDQVGRGRAQADEGQGRKIPSFARVTNLQSATRVRHMVVLKHGYIGIQFLHRTTHNSSNACSQMIQDSAFWFLFLS